MQFVHAFDAIFELATVLRELLGYFVDAAWIAPRGERRIPLSFPTNIAESNFSVHTAVQSPRAFRPRYRQLSFNAAVTRAKS
jgi:hypothetical protein